MVKRARSITLASVLAALLVLAVGFGPLKSLVVEYWWIHQLSSDDRATQAAAMESLGRLGSARGVGPLLEIAAAALERRQSEEDLSFRAWDAVRSIARARPRAVRARCARLLKDDDPMVCRASMEFLAALGFPGSEARSLVAEALSDSDSAVSSQAALVLAHARPLDLDDESIDALKSALAAGHEEARRLAARALGHAGARAVAAVPFLVNALHDQDREVRTEAVAALVAIQRGAAKLADGRAASGTGSMVALLAASLDAPSFDTRIAAVTVLGSIGPAAESALPVLAESLDAVNPNLRAMAARAVGAVLSERNFPIDLGAADSIERQVVANLIEQLGDGHANVRWQTARSLATVLPHTADRRSWVGVFAEALKSRDPQVRFLAAGALGAMGPDAVAAVEALASALNDRAGVVRVGEIRRRSYPRSGGIGQRNSRRTGGGRRLQPESFVRWAVLQALDAMGGAARPYLPAIARCLSDGDNAVVASAAWLIGKLGQTLHDESTAVVIATLDEIAVPVMTKLLKGESTLVRREAAVSLGRLGRRSQAAEAELREVSQQDEKPGVREAAREALARIVADERDAAREGVDLLGATFHPWASASLAAVKLPAGFSIQVFYDGIPNPDGIAVRQDGSLLVVSESNPEGVFIARRGDTFDVTDSFSTVGPPLRSPDAVLLHPNGWVFVAAGQSYAVLRIPPTGGQPTTVVVNRSTISSQGTSNPGVFNPFGLAVAPPTFRGPAVTPGRVMVGDNSNGKSSEWGVWTVDHGLIVRALARGSVFTDGPLHLAFHPDGRLLVHENGDSGGSRIVAVSALGEVTPFVPVTSTRSALAIHPSSGDVYYYGAADEIWRVSSDGERQEVFASGAAAVGQDLEFALDGSALYVSVRGRVLEISGRF